MNVQDIKIASIVPNTYNPNVVKENEFKTLKESIERSGLFQPILIRTHPDDSNKYEIIDGEHRYLAHVDLKRETIPAQVVEMTDAEAKLITITANKLRGHFDSMKLAEVLSDLKQDYSETELQEKLGYTKKELDSFEELIDFDQIKTNDEEAIKTLEDIVDEAAMSAVDDIIFKLTAQQNAVIKAACASYIQEYQGDESNALHQICFDYIKHHGDEKAKNKFGMI